jgi:hypothetical protein
VWATRPVDDEDGSPFVCPAESPTASSAAVRTRVGALGLWLAEPSTTSQERLNPHRRADRVHDVRMPIRAYGLLWRAHEADWSPGRGNRVRFRLLGRTGLNRPGLQVADFRDQRGLYVFYGEYGPHLRTPAPTPCPIQLARIVATSPPVSQRPQPVKPVRRSSTAAAAHGPASPPAPWPAPCPSRPWAPPALDAGASLQSHRPPRHPGRGTTATQRGLRLTRRRVRHPDPRWVLLRTTAAMATRRLSRSQFPVLRCERVPRLEQKSPSLFCRAGLPIRTRRRCATQGRDHTRVSQPRDGLSPVRPARHPNPISELRCISSQVATGSAHPIPLSSI